MSLPLATLRHREPRAVFVPPPYDPRRRASVRAAWRALARDCRTLFLAQDPSDFLYGPDEGISTLYCPLYPSLHQTALASAALVVSGRPEPLELARRLGIPAADLDSPRPEPKAVVDPPRLVPGSGTLHLASITDWNYLPFFAGQMENVWRVHPPVRFHLLALDARVEPWIRSHYPKEDIRVYGLGDLWTPAQLPKVLARSVALRAFSSKPRLIARVLEEVGGPVLYADSDVYFFESPAPLLGRLEQASVLLFPHWNDDFAASRRDGIFNAGMVVAGPGAEVFLGWWGDCTHHECAVDPARALVADQGYLDFAPVYFPEVAVYRDGDHNVARWNRGCLGLGLSPSDPERPVVRGGLPVKSYHAAFADDDGVFEVKYAWDALVAFYSGLPEPERSPAFLYTVLAQQVRHWHGLARVFSLWAQVARRLGRSEKDVSGRFVRFFLRGWGRWVVPVGAWIRQRLVGGRPTPALPEPWVDLHRRALEGTRPPSAPSPAVSSPR